MNRTATWVDNITGATETNDRWSLTGTVRLDYSIPDDPTDVNKVYSIDLKDSSGYRPTFLNNRVYRVKVYLDTSGVSGFYDTYDDIVVNTYYGNSYYQFKIDKDFILSVYQIKPFYSEGMRVTFQEITWEQIDQPATYPEINPNNPLTQGYQVDGNVLYKITSPEGNEPPMNYIQAINEANIGTIQLDINEARVGIWDIKIQRWSYTDYTANATIDVDITVDDYNTVSNLIYTSTLTKWIRVSEEYNTTELYGVDTYALPSGIFGEQGNGKYRTAVMPTQVFGSWLVDNESKIENIIQVNDTMVGSVFITTITYEYKYVEARDFTIIEDTEPGDAGDPVITKERE